MAIVLAGSFLLAGCAAGPTTTASPPPSGGIVASETASPTPAATPTSRLGLSCADVLPEVLVVDLVHDNLITSDMMVDSASATPLGYSVSQLGGVSCRASGEPDLAFVSVQILPDATDQWATFATSEPSVASGDAAAYGDASAIDCLGRGSESRCVVDVLVNASWIALVAQGITVDASLSNADVAEHIAPLITGIVSTVELSGAPTPAWSVPAEAGALPAGCTTYATVVDFQTMFGTTEGILISSDTAGEAIGIDMAAWGAAGVAQCMWIPQDSGQTWQLYVTALPGGEWAFDRAALVASGDGAQTVSAAIDGVERAAFGCHVYTGFCTLDTVIAGNWVQFSVETVRIGSHDEVLAQLIQLAEGAQP